MAKKNKVERQADRAVKRDIKDAKKAVKSGMSIEDYNKIKAADDSLPKPVKDGEARRADRAVKRADRAQKKRWREGAKEMEAELAEVKANNASIEPNAPVEPNAPAIIAELEKEIPKEEVTSTIDGKDPKTSVGKAIIDGADTFDEAKDASIVGDAIKSEVDKVVKEADDSNKIIDANIAEKNLEDSKEKDKGTRNTASGAERYDGDGSALKEAARNGYGKYDFATDEDFDKASKEHQRGNAAAKASAPAAAIEKMGIEHYYPPQQDFITSNFTGRYIGSRQIVSATGSLYPEGLLDARKRATEAKATAKAQAEENYWELTSTAPQYDEDYKEVGMNMLEKYYEASGGDIKGLLTGESKLARQFQRDMYDYKARGKNLLDVDITAKELIKTLNETDNYVPEEVIKTLLAFRSGTKDVDAYMNGETIGDDDMKKMANSLRSYQNFTPLADKKLELLNSLGGDKLPLAKGSDFADPVFAARASEATEKTKGRDYDVFTDVMGEFYDVGAVETIVREMYASNNLFEGYEEKEYEKRIEDGTRYMIAMLPDKVDITTKMQSTNALGWASLSQRDKEWQTKKQWRKEDLESMYDGINREMQNADFEADMIKAHSKGNTPEQRRDAMSMVYKKYGRTPDTTGGYASARLPILGKTVASVVPSILRVVGADGYERTVQNELGTRWTDYHAAVEESDHVLMAEIMSDIRELNYVIDRGTTPIPMNIGSRTVTMSYYDVGTNTVIPLELVDGSIDNSNLTNTVHLGGQIGIDTGVDNDKGKRVYKPSKYQYVNSNNIENEATRRVLSSQEGRAEAVGYSTEYKTDGSVGSFTSGSGSSSQ